MDKVDKLDIPHAKVGERITYVRVVQAETPGRRPDGQGDAPWPKRTTGYQGVLATVVRIGPRVGPVLGDVDACKHRHPRATGALKCAAKRLGPDDPRPRVTW